MGIIIFSILHATLQNDAIPARNFVLLRILVSGVMGVMGGVIPGFLHVDLSWKGVLIGSSGGLALAVVTYFFTPEVVTNDPPLTKQSRMHQ
jgi:MFS-type transporter involved in bile tolerance (Atg22 family)